MKFSWGNSVLKIIVLILVFASSLVQAKVVKLECDVPGYAAKYIVVEIDTSLKLMRFIHTGTELDLTTTPHMYIGGGDGVYIDRTNLSYREGNIYGKCKIFKQREALI